MVMMTTDQAMAAALQFHRAGRLGEAEQIYRQILAQAPTHENALHYLGVLYGESGRMPQAIELIAKAVALYPHVAELHCSLGGYFARTGRIDEGIAELRRALELRRDCPDAHANLGGVLKLKGNPQEAIRVLRDGAAIFPKNADLFYNLGTVYHQEEELDHAVEAFQKTVELNPRHLLAWNNLGSALCLLGRIDEGMVCYDRLMELAPQEPAHVSSHLFMSQFVENLSGAKLEEEHRLWDARCGDRLGAGAVTFTNDRSPNKRLKIGYVSGDLRAHSVAFFLVPLLEAHDKKQVHITCYSNGGKVDQVTERIKRSVDAWCDIGNMNDEAAVARIQADGIDILVDLAGHTANNRLAVFAKRAAPVQVSYLGYPGTTGLKAIDFRLSDSLADPDGDERVWCLPKTAWCFTPLLGGPAVSELPSLRNKFITFGTFNNFAKVSNGVMGLWAKILEQVPGSRLLMKNSATKSESAKRRVRDIFAARGVDASRVEMVAREETVRNHLEWYNKVDIALDTFPYHGTTTTCESLWMGVPVVTLTGDRHASRVGASLLTSVGVAEFIANTGEEYVAKAVGLAGDGARLAALRGALRAQMEKSPLMDGGAFARDVESAFRGMWRRKS